MMGYHTFKLRVSGYALRGANQVNPNIAITKPATHNAEPETKSTIPVYSNHRLISPFQN